MEDKKRYDVKIATLGNLGDPYAARKKSSTSLECQNPWTALKQSGIVACAHCTCMAGLGEVCSHIAAVLFLMEANTKLRHQAPHFHAIGFHQACGVYPYAPIAEIDFTTPARKRQKMFGELPEGGTGLYVKVPLVFYSLMKSLKSFTKLHSKKNYLASLYTDPLHQCDQCFSPLHSWDKMKTKD